MSEETKLRTDEPEATEEPTKLLIDKPSDFKFHAAYLAYSELWDKTSSPEKKVELNKVLKALSEEQISYSSFYAALDDHRSHGSRHYPFARDRIETQRKRDWRAKQSRSQRNQRHKGRH